MVSSDEGWGEWRCGERIKDRGSGWRNPSLPQRGKDNAAAGAYLPRQMRPRPTEVMLKRIQSVRAWGGGLILRGSTEEVKATGRPQVRTTDGIRRTAEFKAGNRMPLFPLLKVFEGS